MTQASGAKTLGCEGGGADNEQKSQPLVVLPSRQLGQQGPEGVMPPNREAQSVNQVVCHL